METNWILLGDYLGATWRLLVDHLGTPKEPYILVTSYSLSCFWLEVGKTSKEIKIFDALHTPCAIKIPSNQMNFYRKSGDTFIDGLNIYPGKLTVPVAVDLGLRLLLPAVAEEQTIFVQARCSSTCMHLLQISSYFS